MIAGDGILIGDALRAIVLLAPFMPLEIVHVEKIITSNAIASLIIDTGTTPKSLAVV